VLIGAVKKVKLYFAMHVVLLVVHVGKFTVKIALEILKNYRKKIDLHTKCVNIVLK